MSLNALHTVLDLIKNKNDILIITLNGQSPQIHRHFKRDYVRTGGVAIYQNSNDTTNILTPNMDIILKNTGDVNVRRTGVVDICLAICKTNNRVEIVIVIIYISPNTKI